MTSTKDIAPVRETQVPEWEHIAVGGNNEKERITPAPRRSVRGAALAKLDSVLPPYKKYIGLSRKTFLWVLLAIVLALLVLIIGLAVGLSQKSRYV